MPVVVTADGGYRNAEVVPTRKPTPTRRWTITFRDQQRSRRSQTLAAFDLGAVGDGLEESVGAALAGEITLERSDVMRELGRAREDALQLAPERQAVIRTSVARSLAAVQHIVEQVVVVRYTGQDIVDQGRDCWSFDCVDAALPKVLAAARSAGFDVADQAGLEALGDLDLWRALSAAQPALPVEADWPFSSSTPLVPRVSQRALSARTGVGSRGSLTCESSSTWMKMIVYTL